MADNKTNTALDGFLTQRELARVTAKIAAAEQMTSAEIKLVIVRNCWLGIRHKAKSVFKKYGLHKTIGRNAVLILISSTDRRFLIYGDKGIDEKVGPGFWDEVKQAMSEAFREGRMGDGVCAGVQMAGLQLARHFPTHDADGNEISDEVVFED